MQVTSGLEQGEEAGYLSGVFLLPDSTDGHGPQDKHGTVSV